MSNETSILSEMIHPGFAQAAKELAEQGNELLGEAIVIAARSAKDKGGKLVAYTIPFELLPSITQALHEYLRDYIANDQLEKILPPIQGEGTLFLKSLEKRLSDGGHI